MPSNVFPIVFLVPVVLFIGLFSFLAVAAWSWSRRKEREALYLNETVRKIAELHGNQAMRDYAHETERVRDRRLQGILTLFGLVAAGGGAGLMIFMWAVEDMREENAYFVALIPIFVGLAMLTYAQLFARKG